ncbi:MAG: hypothetical protein J6N49_03990 [Alphaproteobacteria bacterium]|nr:hypothetical protein [Alphaproteobacteria bacterium]
MKKFILLLAVLCLFAQNVSAGPKPMSYKEEMYLLGAVAGQGLACKSKKYHRFELLARAMILTKATSDEEQMLGMEKYATGKINSFADEERLNFSNCGQVREAFENQKIFETVLYSDGKIKQYDGKVLTPRQPYDATKLYQKDPEAFIKADAAYKKYLAIAQETAKNGPKIELKDSRAAGLSHLFN